MKADRMQKVDCYGMCERCARGVVLAGGDRSGQAVGLKQALQVTVGTKEWRWNIWETLRQRWFPEHPGRRERQV